MSYYTGPGGIYGALLWGEWLRWGQRQRNFRPDNFFRSIKILIVTDATFKKSSTQIPTQRHQAAPQNHFVIEEQNRKLLDNKTLIWTQNK